MYYKLKKHYVLRGWEKLPYALVDTQKGSVYFIGKNEFDALSLCNGNIDVDHFLINSAYQAIIQTLNDNGLIERCDLGDALDPDQNYHCYPARYIKTIHWSMTGRCNYRCKHCYMSAPDAKFGELSHDQCLKIIDEMHACGIMNVSLTGGEPLVRSDFMELVDRLLGYGIKIITIYSNGKLVTAELLDALEKRGIHPEFNMSFDGVGCHDWLRGIDGAEKQVIDAFSLCKERGFPTGAELTLHKKNTHTLSESITLLADLGVAHLKVNPVAPVGAWLENAEDNSLSITETYALYLDYLPEFFKNDSPLTLMLGGFFYARKGSKQYIIPAMKFNNTKESEKKCICGHARLTLYISAEGRALPCMAVSGMEISETYPLITALGLKKCISDSVYMDLIDTRLKEYLAHNEKCNACEYKYICGGGCRASALQDSPMDILSPDLATCTFFKENYSQKIAMKLKEILPVSKK